MTKLTVAEASRRGYGTGLSILQAVQKNWLLAEKDSDGQMLVDANDLEELFGPPNGASSRAAPATSSDREDDSGISRAPVDGIDEGDPPYDDAATPNTHGEFAPDDEDFEAEPDEGWGTAPATPPVADDSAPSADTAPLQAKIARLEEALAAERRRTAALLEVLASRVLPAEQAAPTPSEGSLETPLETDVSPFPASVPAEDTAAAEAIVPHVAPTTHAAEPATETEAPEQPEPEPVVSADLGFPDLPDIADGPDPVIGSDLDNDDDETIEPEGASTVAFAGLDDAEADDPAIDGFDDDTGFDDEESDHAGVAMPPLPSERADLSTPPFVADPQSRAIPQPVTARPAARRAQAASPFIWQLWGLVAFVWIGLIGAFLWYAADLGSNLWVIAEWIRGERAADTPEFVGAFQAVLRAARDTLGPPAALFVVILTLRSLFRALRR